MNMSRIVFSVIICTYNRAALLEKCLESLCEQSPIKDPCEIIVVDNNSIDSTRQVVENYTHKLTNLRYAFETQQGLSNARNRGCREAHGNYLIYLDDDATVPEKYLYNIVEVIEKFAPDIMGGPVYPYYSSPKPSWFRDEYEIRKYENQSGFSRTCAISGGNYIIRKAVLEQLGLFDPHYGMSGKTIGMLEERKVVELYRAMVPVEEQKVFYSLDVYIFHYVPQNKMKLSYLLKRAIAAGRANFYMILDIDGCPDHQKGIRTFAYGIYALLYKLLYQVYHNGFRKVEYINIVIEGLIKIARGFGYMLAQFRYFLGFHKQYRLWRLS